MTKPLFVALKTVFFNQFKSGAKVHELRAGSDTRWSAKHCWAGRPATLSKGYGKYERLTAVVANHSRVPVAELTGQMQQDFITIYGPTETHANVIRFTDIKEIIL